MIAVGDRVPELDLALDDGRIVALSGLLAAGPVVLFFYPKDDSPGCTAEACSFRDAYAAFGERGANVIGISADSAASHTAFAKKHRLPFPLASDTSGAIRKAFGVPKALGILPGRVTFVIGPDGVVRSAFNSMFAPQKHVAAALDAITALRA